MDYSSSFLPKIAWWTALSTSQFLQETLYDFLVFFSLSVSKNSHSRNSQPSGWSPCFPVRNFSATGRYSRCSYVVLSATNLNMHSRCHCKIIIFCLLISLTLAVSFWKMVLKFDKYGSRQIEQILGLSIIKHYYIFAILLSLLISEKTLKAPLHMKYKAVGNWGIV